MTQAGWYKTDEWWDIMDMFVDAERDKVLAREQREVRNEMICQEHKTGKDSRLIAADFNLDYSTVCRIIREGK